jgi:hypothetical protein
MKNETPETLDLSFLMSEIRRYLAAVGSFRAEGHGPRWLPEPVRQPPVPGLPPVP